MLRHLQLGLPWFRQSWVQHVPACLQGHPLKHLLVHSQAPTDPLTTPPVACFWEPPLALGARAV